MILALKKMSRISTNPSWYIDAHMHPLHTSTPPLLKKSLYETLVLSILILQVLQNWPAYIGTKQAKAMKFKTPANEVGKIQCTAVIHTAIQDCPFHVLHKNPQKHLLSLSCEGRHTKLPEKPLTPQFLTIM